MKANKFFAAAMAALTLVGFSACKPQNQPTGGDALELTETAIQMKVGETHQLQANVAVETWTSSNEQVATVKDGLVTAKAEGNAIISATAKGVTKTCVVAVKNDGGQQGGASVKGSKVWPIIMDGVTYEANADKIVASFQPNDDDKWLYIWESTYVANTNPTGKNFAGNTEGFTALTVSTVGWAGGGFCISTKDDEGKVKGEAWKDVEALRAAIVAAPDDYYLHMAIKSTDQGSHCFYVFGSEATKFVLGSKSVYDGPIMSDFTRDGSWAEFDIPMSSYASALASTTCEAGVNVFVLLSEGVAGVNLNLDAVYFYKK